MCVITLSLAVVQLVETATRETPFPQRPPRLPRPPCCLINALPHQRVLNPACDRYRCRFSGRRITRSGRLGARGTPRLTERGRGGKIGGKSISRDILPAYRPYLSATLTPSCALSQYRCSQRKHCLRNTLGKQPESFFHSSSPRWPPPLPLSPTSPIATKSHPSRSERKARLGARSLQQPGGTPEGISRPPGAPQLRAVPRRDGHRARSRRRGRTLAGTVPPAAAIPRTTTPIGGRGGPRGG